MMAQQTCPRCGDVLDYDGPATALKDKYPHRWYCANCNHKWGSKYGPNTGVTADE